MFKTIEEARKKIGCEIGLSDWVIIDQEKIDAHARTTGDSDWLHNDPERARRESPFGGTIAQGSLLLSHLVKIQESVAPVAEHVDYVLNYGFDRVRFLSPVLAGGRVRGRLSLEDVNAKEEGRYLFKMKIVLESEGSSKPALVAEWLGLVGPRSERTNGHR